MRRYALLSVGILMQIAVGFGFHPAMAATSSEGQSEPRCAALTQASSQPLFSAGVGIVFGPEVPPDLIQAAVEHWSQCEGYGTDFPAFRIGQPGTQTVEVRFDKAFRSRPRCGSFVGRTVALYSFAADRRGRVRFCGSRVDGLVHELGHVLGLLDAPGERGCDHHAMASIDSSDRDRRQIQADECHAVSERWLTPQELQTDTEPMRVASRSTGGF